MSTIRKVPGRKRGGQQGNKNAQQHGFYGQLYTAEEQSALSKPLSLDDEQNLLRSRVLRLARKITLKTLTKPELAAMNTMSLLIQTIATLERTKLLARGKGGEIGKTILEALSELDPYEEL